MISVSRPLAKGDKQVNICDIAGVFEYAERPTWLIALRINIKTCYSLQ